MAGFARALCKAAPTQCARLERLARRLGLSHPKVPDVATFASDVQAVESVLRAGPPLAHPVAFYGSSSIRLWTTLAEDFPDVPVANLGFGGSTIAACSWFYYRLVRPLEPRALVFYAGDNDLGHGSSPNRLLEQFELLLAQLDATFPNIPLSVISIKPSPALSKLLPLIAEANRALKARLSGRKNSQFLDVFDVMLANGRPRRELFLEDGLHMNDTGYALWRRVLRAHRSAAF